MAIIIKTEKEIALMRKAGAILAKAHQAAKEAIRPGITTAEIDTIVRETILSHDATPSFLGLYSYPASACISINEQVVHGIPKNRALQKGDLVSVDIGACYKGYHGDAAKSHYIESEDEERNRLAKKLIEVTRQSFYEGIKFAKVGYRLTDISHAIQKHAESNGFSVVRELCGHGIGSDVHEDPMVLNYGLPRRGAKLKPGMVLAIEPMINAGKREILILEDKWTVVTRDGSLSAHYEHSVLITQGEPELLTK